MVLQVSDTPAHRGEAAYNPPVVAPRESAGRTAPGMERRPLEDQQVVLRMWYNPRSPAENVGTRSARRERGVTNLSRPGRYGQQAGLSESGSKLPHSKPFSPFRVPHGGI